MAQTQGNEKPIAVFVSLALTIIVGVPVPTSARDLNGPSLNGDSIGEAIVEYAFLDEVELEGVPLDEVWYEDGLLRGAMDDGSEIPAYYFKGATIDAVRSDGEMIELRIDHIYSGFSANMDAIPYYQVSYEMGGSREPLCGWDHRGYPIAAILLEGAWDYSEGTSSGGSKTADEGVVTFACGGHALAKCVEAGYLPWEGMGRHHQACTRMMRADYCGDGTPHTKAGTPVIISDSMGIREPAMDLSFAAEWDEQGAICFRTPRTDDAPPICEYRLRTDSCGEKHAFDETTLLMSAP